MLDIEVGGEKITVTPEHEFWVEGEGWKQARELWRGAPLRTKEGKVVRVEWIGKREGVFRVYNFEVGDAHTYFVGRLGLLVHNCADKIRRKPGKLGERKGTDALRRENRKSRDAVKEATKDLNLNHEKLNELSDRFHDHLQDLQRDAGRELSYQEIINAVKEFIK